MIHFQLLLVTGGWDIDLTVLDSTEVYQDNEWKIVSGKLPLALVGTKVATIDDRVLSFGNIYFS